MLSEGRYGVEIITQISAVNTALEAVAVNVLNDHDNHCVAGGLACGDEGWRPRRGVWGGTEQNLALRAVWPAAEGFLRVAAGG
jgi:hypothetical protein